MGKNFFESIERSVSTSFCSTALIAPRREIIEINRQILHLGNTPQGFKKLKDKDFLSEEVDLAIIRLIR